MIAELPPVLVIPEAEPPVELIEPPEDLSVDTNSV
jgi:hypothetical protein